MSGSLGDFSLFDLFRQEAESHCAALNEGLLAIESQPSDLAHIEPLMRAAHSIKGAARIIGFDAAVTLAHAMEECLVAVQKGTETLTSGRVDQLLRGVDVLEHIAALTEEQVAPWSAENGPAIGALSAVLRQPPPVESDPAPPSAPADERPDAVAAAPAGGAPAREAPAAAAPAAPAPEPRAAPPPKPTARPVATKEDGAVRVDARSLDRMMQLASETMIASRRFEVISRQFEQLREVQRRIAAAFGERRGGRSTDDDASRQAGQELETALRGHAGDLERAAWRCEELSTALYHEVLGSRMRPFAEGVSAFPRMIRDLARSLDKRVSFEILGETVPVDRDIQRKLEAPLNHMLRNAVDHGIETPEVRQAAGKSPQGHITLRARHHAGMLTVEVQDDGRGIDPEAVRRRVVERGLADPEMAKALSKPELMDFLFLPGFSTRQEVSEVSGRGVGLDVVQSMVQEVAGTMRVSSDYGRSTTFTFHLPVTLSVIRAALARIGDELYAFPLSRLVRVMRVACGDIRPVEGRQQFEMDGESVGLVGAAAILGLGDSPPSGESVGVLVIGQPGLLCALTVDDLLGEQDLVVRPLDARLGRVPHISASALLDTGEPLLIVDIDDLFQSVQHLLREGSLRGVTSLRTDTAAAAGRVLVVDDSITVREVERQLLKKHGYEVDVAVDGQDGWNALRATQYDLLISDVDMPRMNGIELVRHVRRDPRLAELPIVIVSYKDREEDRLAGMEAGANAYLTKASFHDDSLIATVAKLIGGH